MSLVRMTRRRRQQLSTDKPQLERIEHANLERPGARMHPRATAIPRPQARPVSCKTERPGA